MQTNYGKEGPAVMPLLLKNASRNNVALSNQSLLFVFLSGLISARSMKDVSAYNTT